MRSLQNSYIVSQRRLFQLTSSKSLQLVCRSLRGSANSRWHCKPSDEVKSERTISLKTNQTIHENNQTLGPILESTGLTLGRKSRLRCPHWVKEIPSDNTAGVPFLTVQNVLNLFASKSYRFLHANEIPRAREELFEGQLLTPTASKSQVLSHTDTDFVGHNVSEPVSDTSVTSLGVLVLRELNSLSVPERNRLWESFRIPPWSKKRDTETSNFKEKQLQQIIEAFRSLFFFHGLLIEDVPIDVFFERVSQLLTSQRPTDFFNPDFVKTLKQTLYGDNILPIPSTYSESQIPNRRWRDPAHIRIQRERLIETITKQVVDSHYCY